LPGCSTNARGDTFLARMCALRAARHAVRAWQARLAAEQTPRQRALRSRTLSLSAALRC